MLLNIHFVETIFNYCNIYWLYLKYKKFVFIFLLLILCSCEKEIISKNSFNIFLYDTLNSGLPSNYVYKLAIDKNNNLWIGTFSKGIVKFDGNNWICFNTKNSQLPNDSISSLYTNGDRIYIGTRNGLAIYENNFWIIYNMSNSNLKAEIILSICNDHNSNIWIGAVSHKDFNNVAGLYIFDGVNWTYYNQKNSILPYETILSIVCDNKNVIWLGTAQFQGRGGLVSIENGNWTLYSKENSPMQYNTVDRIILGVHNELLLSSDVLFEFNEGLLDGYLYLFDKNGVWSDISPAYFCHDLTNRVTSTTIDNNGNFWVATSIDPNRINADYSLSRYKDGKWFILSSTHKNFPRTYIPDLVVDNSNILWVAAPDAGGLIMITEN